MELEKAHPRTQEGTTITDLPTEILSQIVSFLPRDSHLVQIALVSKRFKDLAERVLYRSISLRVIPLDKKEGYLRGSPNDLNRFYWLVESLTLSPHLCRFVVALRLLVFYERWSQDFNDHHHLITLLPSLKELTMSPPPPHLHLTTSNRLEILRLDLRDYFQQFEQGTPELDLVDPLEVVAQHFWIPTLRSLQFSTFRPYRGRWSRPFPRERYRTSPITDLRVLRCNDDDIAFLPEILLSVRRLKRFMFASDGCQRWDHSPAKCIPPYWFARALEPHQATLVELVIAGSDTASFLRTPLFGTLATYTNLKRLTIPEPFLVQPHGLTIHEWLPQSLEVLQLQISLRHSIELDEEQPFRFTRLKHLAEHKLACFPALTRVTLWIEYYGDWDWSSLGGGVKLMACMDQLVGKFKEVGVKLKLRSAPSFAWMHFGKEFQWYRSGRDVWHKHTMPQCVTREMFQKSLQLPGLKAFTILMMAQCIKSGLGSSLARVFELAQLL